MGEERGRIFQSSSQFSFGSLTCGKETVVNFVISFKSPV